MVDDAARESENLLEGTPYRAVKRIAGGGMGEIYEAIDASEQPVVVKLLRSDLVRHPDLIDRMRLEGEILGLFAHPNIVAGRGFGKTQTGRPFVAMEQLHGKPLRQLMKRNVPMSLETGLEVIIQLLLALEQVHDAGVVHRDVKPENIMICPAPGGRWQVKLLDFGIAKPIGCAVSPLANPTMHGACVGTPRYAAPEQAKGAPVDPRTDIYAAGLILYALVAGRGPFDALKEPHRLLEAHMKSEPESPSRFAPLPLPVSLEAAIMRALAKEPSERFADAASFRRELAMVLGRRCIDIRPWLDEAFLARAAAKPRTRVELIRSLPIRPNRALAVRAPPAPPALPPSALPPLPRIETTRAAPASERVATAARARARVPGAKAGNDGAPVSSMEVLLSAAAFAAAASGLAMWFVR
jgi:serine/threonine protein kinase